MRPDTLTNLIVIVAISTLAMATPRAEAQQAKQTPHYYVFNLGDPGGGSISQAASINNVDWIAGNAYQPGDSTEHAELWVGAPVDLLTLGGPNSAVAWPNKNTRGQIAGTTETADMNPYNEAWSCAIANFPAITNHICYGFIWENGVMTALPPLPGGLNSYAAGINNKGQVAGWAENGVQDPTCNNTQPFNQVLQFEAVVWGPKPGEMTQLSSYGADPDSAATAVNDKGQIVGISGLCDIAAGNTSAEHAVLWPNKYAPPIDLGNFDGGLAWNTPTAINNRGQVVGFGNQKGSLATDFNPIAFYWNPNGIQPIPPIGDDSNSWAWGINRKGVVVGQSFGGADDPLGRAFIYEDGQLNDLNNLVQSDSSLQLQLANDINDEGEIVGFARDLNTGATVPFLAVPVEGSNPLDVGRMVGRISSKSGPRNSTLPSAGTFGRFATGSNKKSE